MPNALTTRTHASPPTAAGLASRLALEELRHRKIEPEPLLAQARLSAAGLADRTRISVASQIRFLELVSSATGDDCIGLTLAKSFDLRETGMLYYVAASSHRLGDALSRLERYVRLGNEALVVTLRQGNTCRIGLGYTGVPRHRERHQIEAFAMILLRLCRQLVGQRLVPVSVRFLHHRSRDLQRINEIFACRVEFDAEADEIEFVGTVKDLPVVGDDPFLNQLMEKDCEAALAERFTNVSPFRITVENVIASLMPHAETHGSKVAQHLGLSERTFARRLASEGLSYGEILDDLRRDLAVFHLQHSDLQLAQIAWRLGFQQPSSFSHACRRWFGMSPLAFRRSLTT
jgi:AraC-like DNA-binding protein